MTILRSEARYLNAFHSSADKLLCDGPSRSSVKSYFSNWLKNISKLACSLGGNQLDLGRNAGTSVNVSETSLQSQ